MAAGLLIAEHCANDGAYLAWAGRSSSVNGTTFQGLHWIQWPNTQLSVAPLNTYLFPTSSLIGPIAYGNGKWLVLTTVSQPEVFINSSVHLSTGWVRFKSNGSGNNPSGIRDITFGNGIFVAVGTGIFTTTDGITWANRSSNLYDNIRFLNGQFIAFSRTGTTYLVSADGINWSASRNFPQSVADINYINGYYVISPTAPNLSYPWATSTDLVNWTARTAGSGPLDQMYIFRGQLHCAVNASAGKVSSDGLTWTVLNGNVYGYRSAQRLARSTTVGTGDNAITLKLLVSPSTSVTLPDTYVYNPMQWWTAQGYATIPTFVGGGVETIITPVINTDGTSGGSTTNPFMGLIVRDENGVERIQSYDPTKANYLTTRLVKTVSVTANTTISVPEANGYQIFVHIAPTGAMGGAYRIPYATYSRGAAPTYTPAVNIIYPAFSGNETQSITAADVMIFTNGKIETTVY